MKFYMTLNDLILSAGKPVLSVPPLTTVAVQERHCYGTGGATVVNATIIAYFSCDDKRTINVLSPDLSWSLPTVSLYRNSGGCSQQGLPLLRREKGDLYRVLLQPAQFRWSQP
jgi:hypothetical protein